MEMGFWRMKILQHSPGFVTIVMAKFVQSTIPIYLEVSKLSKSVVKVYCQNVSGL